MSHMSRTRRIGGERENVKEGYNASNEQKKKGLYGKGLW